MNNKIFEDLLEMPKALDYDDAGNPPVMDDQEVTQQDENNPDDGPEIIEAGANDNVGEDTISVGSQSSNESEEEINIDAADEIPHEQQEVLEDAVPSPRSIIDVVPDNIIPEGVRQGQVPSQRNDIEGYEFVTNAENDFKWR